MGRKCKKKKKEEAPPAPIRVAIPPALQYQFQWDVRDTANEYKEQLQVIRNAVAGSEMPVGNATILYLPSYDKTTPRRWMEVTLSAPKQVRLLICIHNLYLVAFKPEGYNVWVQMKPDDEDKVIDPIQGAIDLDFGTSYGQLGAEAENFEVENLEFGREKLVHHVSHLAKWTPSSNKVETAKSLMFIIIYVCEALRSKHLTNLLASLIVSNSSGRLPVGYSKLYRCWAKISERLYDDQDLDSMFVANQQYQFSIRQLSEMMGVLLFPT